MDKKTQRLLNEIEVLASNPITRTISKFKFPFKGDTNTYKYRISLLNSFVELKQILDDLEVSTLGTSGESIFSSVQYITSANRHLNKITNLLTVYVNGKKSQNPDQINEKNIEINNIDEMIKDFNLNKFHFEGKNQELFDKIQANIEKYELGDFSLAKDIKDNYIKLINYLSESGNDKSLEDVLVNKAGLKVEAGVFDGFKKWYGKAVHTLNLFGTTSPVRLELAKNIVDIKETVNKAMNDLEKRLDPFEIFNYLTEIKNQLNHIRQTAKPLIDLMSGSQFSGQFVNMLQKNKLTDIPNNLTDKDVKQLETRLKNKEFRDLIDMYGKK